MTFKDFVSGLPVRTSSHASRSKRELTAMVGAAASTAALTTIGIPSGWFAERVAEVAFSSSFLQELSDRLPSPEAFENEDEFADQAQAVLRKLLDEGSWI